MNFAKYTGHNFCFRELIGKIYDDVIAKIFIIYEKSCLKASLI